MSVNNGIITEPINVKDPYDAMGLTPLVLNGDLIYDIKHASQSRSLNIESFYKPITGNGTIIPNIDNPIAGKNGFYGYDFTYITTSPKDVDNFSKYEYAIPYNGYVTNEEFGILNQFIGYNHYQKLPLCEIKVPESIKFAESIPVECIWGDNSNESICPKNIVPFKDYYFTIALFHVLGTKRYFSGIKSCTQKIGNAYKENMIITDYSAPNGVVLELTPFLSEYPMTMESNLECKKYQLYIKGNNTKYIKIGGISNIIALITRAVNYYYIPSENADPILQGINVFGEIRNNTSNKISFPNLQIKMTFYSSAVGTNEITTEYKPFRGNLGSIIKIEPMSYYTINGMNVWFDNGAHNAKSIGVELIDNSQTISGGNYIHVF